MAHAKGEHIWHTHEQTDEFFLVIDGQFDVSVRDADDTDYTVELYAGDVFVVPEGIEHKPASPGGAILMFEPAGRQLLAIATLGRSRTTSAAPPAHELGSQESI